MNKIIASIIILTSCTVFAVNNDYKKQMTLELEGNSSGYTFAVPDDVYLNSYYSDLRDMRIINATGDFVPMRAVLSTHEVIHEYGQTTLPIFKLNKTITSSVDSKQTRTTIAGTDEDYTIVTSKSLNHFLETLEIESPNQIIIDAAVLKDQKIEKLEIQWQYKTKGNRVFNVELSASNDLSEWKLIKKRQQLIEINTNARTLLENTIELDHQAYSYYRITFTDKIIPKITQVKAWLVNQTIKKSQQTKEISYYSIVNNSTLQFDIGGVYTIESFILSFDQENTVTDVKMYARNKLKDKWRFVTDGSIYSMTSNGVNVKKDTINVRDSNNRYWQIQFDENINSKSVNQISMNWRKHQVEFLAQGNAPFTLMYSNSDRLKPVSSNWYHKIPTELKKKMFSPQVNIGVDGDIKGTNQRIQQLENNKNYAQWIFWLILAIVLLVLLIMAYKLINEKSDN